MDKYEEVDRARRLLRQGAQKAALEVLDNLCENWDSISDEVNEEDKETLELAFHPRGDDIPNFYIDDGCLCIDNNGWEIIEDFTTHLAKIASSNYQMGTPDGDLRNLIVDILRAAVKSGKVRRKGNGEEV